MCTAQFVETLHKKCELKELFLLYFYYQFSTAILLEPTEYFENCTICTCNHTV